MPLITIKSEPLTIVEFIEQNNKLQRASKANQLLAYIEYLVTNSNIHKYS